MIRLRKNKNMKKMCILAQIILIFISCSLSNPRQTKDVIAINREKWDQKKIIHYMFTQQLSCFCPPTTREPKVIEVNQGKVVAVDGSKTGNGNNVGKTFSELFDWIEEEKVKNPFISEYTFDQKYGFPNMIYFNMRENIKDEELRYVFTDFKIID